MPYCALSATVQTELALHTHPVLHPLCSQQIKDSKMCHASTNIEEEKRPASVLHNFEQSIPKCY